MSAEQDINRLFEHYPESASAPSKKLRPQRAFNVYLKGKKIDTVFYGAGVNVDVDEVTDSLINHDGYDPGIVVREERRK